MRLGFIFSVPRAGSTYVQRVLAGGKGVATVSEPWLLPALMGIRYGAPPLADFAYDHVRVGLNDALGNLSQPEPAWQAAIAAMAQSFYGNFANQDALFLDKTPRNAGFCQEILSTFPKAKVLFLWRNPLAVVSSMNETWGAGHWKSYFYHHDLFHGQQQLIKTYLQQRSDPRVMAATYEDLVTDPHGNWPQIFDHFEVPYNEDAVTRPGKLTGVMGDETGQARYQATSALSVNKWKTGFGNGIRRRWARRYLDYLGAENLAMMGYDSAALKAGIMGQGTAKLSDYALIPLAPAYHWVEPYILRSKISRFGRSGFARR